MYRFTVFLSISCGLSEYLCDFSLLSFFRFFTSFIFVFFGNIRKGVPFAFLPFLAFLHFSVFPHNIWMKWTFCSFFAPWEKSLKYDVSPHSIWLKWSFGKKWKNWSNFRCFVKTASKCVWPIYNANILNIDVFFETLAKIFQLNPKSMHRNPSIEIRPLESRSC